MHSVARPRVDLIVPTYGGTEQLRACLRSLTALQFRDYRLIVVDDASPAPALPVVATEHAGATVLRARENGGLVRAMNRGIAAGNAPYVALLNDDTEVTPDWLGALVACAERNPNAGSVASKIRLMSDRRKLHSAGDGFGVWGMPFNRGVWLDDLGQYDREEEVFGACAGAALYRRSALTAVQLEPDVVFDPQLWMYLEDVDLAWRLRRQGYSCIYAPDAVVYHHLSATAGGALASYYVSRNIWHILLRSAPGSYLKRNFPHIVAHHVGRNLRHARGFKSAEARASLKGTMAGVVLFARPWHVSAPKAAQGAELEARLTRRALVRSPALRC